MTNVRGWEGGKEIKGEQESAPDRTHASVVLWFVFTLAVGGDKWRE